MSISDTSDGVCESLDSGGVGAVIPSVECNSENLDMYTYQHTHTRVHVPQPVVGGLSCFWNCDSSEPLTVAFRSFAVREGVIREWQSSF